MILSKKDIVIKNGNKAIIANGDKFTRTVVKIIETDSDVFNLHFCGDWHVGSTNFDYPRFNDYCDILEKDSNGGIVFMGDLLETAIEGSVGNHYGELSLQESSEFLQKRIERFSDKVICYVDGNHEERCNRKGIDTPLEKIMTNAGVKQSKDKYSKHSIKLILFIHNTVKNTYVQYDVVIRHKMISVSPSAKNQEVGVRGKMNSYVRDRGITADIICCGHAHIPMCCKTEVPFVDWNETWLDDSMHRFDRKYQYLGMNGSLLKFVESYADLKDYMPQSLDQIYFELSTVDKKIVPHIFSLDSVNSYESNGYEDTYADTVYKSLQKLREQTKGCVIVD